MSWVGLRTWYQQSLDAGFKLNAGNSATEKVGKKRTGILSFHSVHLHGLEGDYEELIDVALAKRDVKAAAFWYKSAKERNSLPTEAALL